MITFEAFQTVPVVALRDMDPYMAIQESNPPFPIPGEEYHFIRLDLSRALIKNPGQTFFIQLTDDAMLEAGLLPGDILIVDRSMEPRSRSIIIAYLDGEFIVRRLEFSHEGMQLVAEHPEMTPIEIEPDMEFGIWGVVRDIIHEQGAVLE